MKNEWTFTSTSFYTFIIPLPQEERRFEALVPESFEHLGEIFRRVLVVSSSSVV